MYACMYVCISLSVVYMYIHIYILYIYMHVYIQLYTQISVCVYIYIKVCIYIHILKPMYSHCCMPQKHFSLCFTLLEKSLRDLSEIPRDSNTREYDSSAKFRWTDPYTRFQPESWVIGVILGVALCPETKTEGWFRIFFSNPRVFSPKASRRP